MSNLASTYKGANPKSKERVQDIVGKMVTSSDGSVIPQYIDEENRLDLTLGSGPGSLAAAFARIAALETDAMLKPDYDPDGNFQVNKIDETTEYLTALAPGQTIFTLTRVPLQPVNSKFSVNGLIQRWGVDYLIAGNTLTWLASEPILEPSDTIEIQYL